jgi:transcriptional regulator with XRE-family HTH domain
MTMLPTTPEETRADLRRWRMLQGLSQARLAGYLGVTWLTVQRWESGTRAMPAFLWLALRELERQLSEPPFSDSAAEPERPAAAFSIL